MRTFGTVRFDEGAKMWVLKAEPHVLMRFKQIMPRVNKYVLGEVHINDTPEVAREIEWFIQRYPLEVKHPEILQQRSNVHKEREAKVVDIMRGHIPPSAFQLAFPPREYQKIAATLALTAGGLLLADDVGLGKTVSAICTLTEPQTLPALVVTLTHLPLQWKAEINRFAPNLNVHIVKRGKPYEVTADVLILNYHKLYGWANTLAGAMRSVIFDECQELRRTESNKYQGAQYIANAAQYRIGLSATPIYNYGGEIHSVLNCIFPGALGTSEEFNREWCSKVGMEKPTIREPRVFGSYMRESGMMLRRTRVEVGRELPQLTKIPHLVDIDDDVFQKNTRSCADLARKILNEGKSERGEKFFASDEFVNLMRQATGIAKAPYVAEFVRMLVETGERVLLYGWHRSVYEIWLRKLAVEALHPILFTGSETPKQKEEAKQAFLDGHSKVLIMSLRAGAGVDGLQKVCRTVVFGELDWSPGVHEQNTGRIHRDGQTDPVMAYYLLSQGGSDPVMAEVLGLKKAQVDGLRDMKEELISTLDRGESHVKRLAQAYLESRGVHA